MAGLPHYSNSQASTEAYEPLYLNQFEVVITPPSAVTQDAAILLEHVKNVSGLPEITPVGTVEQFYKFAKRTYAAARPEDTTAQIEIEFEVNLDEDNSPYVYNILREWANIIFDPLTGAQGLKRNYTGEMYVAIFNKRGNIYREFRFKPVFLINNFNEMELDYVSDDIYRLTATFQADAWTETRL
jgi:hypothetical protein